MGTPCPRATPCPPGFTDHIYKVDHGVEVPLRIWAASSSANKRPWLLWIHGGGFVAGKHVVPNAWILPASRLYGYHVVSIAYRLLPHAQLPHMLSDCADALRWCIQNLASIIGTDQVDLNSFVVAGDSAGGMLSTLCGHYLDPKPKAVISLFGITDPTDNVFHLKTGRNPWGPYAAERDEDEMRRHLERRDLSEAEVICPWDWEVDMPLEQLRSYWGMPSFTPNESHAYRMDLNRLMSNDGTRFAYLLQRHRYQSDKEFEEGMKLYSPYHLLQEGRSYPPTVILHGKKDRMVSVEQSYRFAARLKELGVPVEERYPPDGDHSFDAVIESQEDAGWEEYIVPCMEFLEKHLQVEANDQTLANGTS